MGFVSLVANSRNTARTRTLSQRARQTKLAYAGLGYEIGRILQSFAAQNFRVQKEKRPGDTNSPAWNKEEVEAFSVLITNAT